MADCNKFNVHRIDIVSTVPGTYKQDTYYQIFQSLHILQCVKQKTVNISEQHSSSIFRVK